MTEIADFRWRLASPDILLDKFDQESAVLFHCASADTHLLDPFGAELVALLQLGDKCQSELFGYISENLNYELDDALTMHLEVTLASLQRLEVVERA